MLPVFLVLLLEELELGRMIAEGSPEEKKILDKAKAILMERNGMTEPEAFRYIQKTSMDTGRTSVETAEMILFLNDG